MSALDLTFPNAHFDHVICAHVQTVVPDLPKAVSEIHRVRKAHRTFKPRIPATRLQAIASTVPPLARFPAIAVRR
jgi:ubiquinone/menaquinone biosynthesis C-methylase UbiE